MPDNLEGRNPTCPRSILNPGTIQKIVALQRPGRPSPLKRVLAAYRRASTRQLEELVAAFARGDFPAVSATAHALKSGSATIGADALSDICRQLEHAAAGGELESDDLIQELQREFPLVLEAVQRTLEVENECS